MGEARTCVLSCMHDDHWFVQQALESCGKAGPILTVVNRMPWHGSPGDWHQCVEAAKRAGAEVFLGDWENESEHRRAALAIARERGFTHAIIPDGDEILDPSLIDALIKLANARVAERVYAHMDTYWKSAHYLIRPREQLTPVILIDLNVVEHRYIRDYQGGRAIVLGPEYGVIHHLSYAGPDERIHRKLETWSHRNEVQPEWFRSVWKLWDENHLLRNLHPTHPAAYGFAERIDIPDVLEGVWDERQVAQDPERPTLWPKVSVVIPLYGGEEDIASCLASLQRSADLLHEVFVVDDCSPDNAADRVAEFPFAKLLTNVENLGFGGACNVGAREASGDVILFLNSDTVTPRAGLIRLIESLMVSGTVGAAGPLSNNAGYHQATDITYTETSNCDNFARDFADRDAEDIDVPILVGFCLAVRKSVLNEVGLFDERFGRGLFEDNDLCYRIQRAGYKCRLSSRAFVHHEGSKSLARIGEPAEVILARNMDLYHAKWREELESGFASHLPGQIASPIVFNAAKHPDAVRARSQKLAKKADISLCMIVRDEERVISNCLASVEPYFAQTVIVDTGSKDRTIEICRTFGADVHAIRWANSFAAARNESLRHATGKWIFWLDADDTLPAGAGEAILNAALHAPRDVAGFIVPVQFVEEGPGAGTRVDHVKLFRNYPGIRFEGRIHEQILGSLRERGEIVRIPNVCVLHSGYDTSPEGQAKKRRRDEKLLKLDLKERPTHPFVLFNLGMTAHFTNDHEAAVKWLDRSIKHSGQNDSHLRKAYALLGVSKRVLGDSQAALDSFQRGIDQVGPDPELEFQTALTLGEMGRFREAKEKYLGMSQDTSGFFSSIDVGILGFKRLANLGRVCLALGEFGEATHYLVEAFKLNSRVEAPAVDLIQSALERGDIRSAQSTVDLIRELAGPTENWAKFQAAIHDERGEDADRHLYLTTKRHPCSTGPRIVLARRLLNTRREAEALPQLEILDGLGNAEAAFFRGVIASRRGEFALALQHMERAHDLNPLHAETLEQVTRLRSLLAQDYS